MHFQIPLPEELLPAQITNDVLLVFVQLLHVLVQLNRIGEDLPAEFTDLAAHLVRPSVLQHRRPELKHLQTNVARPLLRRRLFPNAYFVLRPRVTPQMLAQVRSEVELGGAELAREFRVRSQVFAQEFTFREGLCAGDALESRPECFDELAGFGGFLGGLRVCA